MCILFTRGLAQADGPSAQEIFQQKNIPYPVERIHSKNTLK